MIKFVAMMLSLFGVFFYCGFIDGQISPEASSSTEENQDSVDFDVERFVDAWVAMWNTYDLLEVDELFLDSADLTYFSSEKEGVIKGIDAVREHHVGFGFVKGGKKQDNKLWMEDIDYSVFDSTVVVTGIWFFARAGEEAEKVQKGPVTIVYAKSGDEYRIVHMHFANYE